MDAKRAAQIIKSGNFGANDFQALYTALNGNAEFAEEFNELRKAMLKSYADGESIEINQSGKVDQQDVMVVDQNAGDSVSQEKQLKDVEPWKIQRRQEIMQWAAKSKNNEITEIKANKDGLNTSFKDGTQVNFVAENHVSVKTPEEPKAQNFDMVVALAKNSNKKVKLGENMSPEFRAALIEACAKANVQISNLTIEDLDTYMKFLPKQEEKQVLNIVEQKTQTQTGQVRQQQSVAEKPAVTPVAEKKGKETPVVETKTEVTSAPKDNGIAQVVAAVAANAAAREASASAVPTEPKPVAKKTAKDKGNERIAELAAEAAAIAREIQEMASKQVKKEQEPKPVTEKPVVQQPAQGGKKEEEIAFIPVARSLEKELEEQPVEEQKPTAKTTEKPKTAEKGSKGKTKGGVVVPVVTEKPVAEQEKGTAETPVKDQPGPQSQGAVGRTTDTGNKQPAPKPAEKKQEPKKEGFWSKWGRKIKHAAIIASVAVASFFVGRCSNTPAEQGAGNNDGEKAKTEIVAKPTTTPIVADTLQTDDNKKDLQIRLAPTKWDASMGITEAQFNNMYNIIHKHDADGELWGRMHLNAQLHAAEFSMDASNPMTAEQFMFKTLRMAAWTNKLNGKICETHNAEWAYNYSGAFGHVLGPTMGVLKCGDHIEAETLEKAKIMLSAVGKNGSINVFTLDKVVAGTSRFNNHDEQGWIIGTTRNVMTGIDVDCGRESEVEFNRGGAVTPKPQIKPQEKPQPRKVVPQDTIVVKKDPVTIEIPGDTTVVKKPDVVIEIPGDTTVVVPTRAVPEKPQPEEKLQVNIGSRANLSARPAAEAVDHTQEVINNGSEQNMTRAQRRQARKMAKEMLESGRIDQKTYDAMLEEIKEPTARNATPMATNTGRG